MKRLFKWALPATQVDRASRPAMGGRDGRPTGIRGRARMSIEKSLIVTIATIALATNATAGDLLSCTFTPNAWNSNDWLLVKSPRWDHFGGWVQREDCIENETPAGATPKELLGKRAPETYTSMVLKQKVKGKRVDVYATMAFADRMAPLIVIAPALGADAEGRPEYREHWEIVLYDEGLNVWRHVLKDGKPWWRKAAFVQCAFKPNVRYKLGVRVEKTPKGRMLSVCVDDAVKMGYMDDSLPDEFHVGITGCEGVNRFYDFSVER
ncbi:MAG: hypothetical protein JXR37_32980 [Kiritimatiellae bacterium]|nr:hypothetical protein [Kiritimatiellia bacterium]